MKKYVNPSPIPNGGIPIFGGDFMDCLQFEIYRAIIAGYTAYSEPIILHGCQVVDTGGGTCTISAGMSFINGDLIDVPAYNGTYPVYLQEGNPVTVSKNYKDSQARPVHITKTTEWVNAQPGAGDFIKFDPYTSQYLKDVQRRFTTPLKQIEWYPDYPNPDAFNVNGVGKWEWLGFNVANGYGGLTTNMTGRVPVQFNPNDALFAIGNTTGAAKHQLTILEMPVHDHPKGFNWATNDSGTGSTDQGGGASPAGNTGAAGGNQPHNNMQPSIMGVWLQRVEV